MYKKTYIVIFLLFSLNSFSQFKWGIGGSGLYHIKNKDFGLSARVIIPVKQQLWAVPYIFYYFPIGKLSGGLSAMAPFYQYQMFQFYAVASASINAKVSVTVNDSTTETKNNYKSEAEGGFGVLIGPGCLKGMVEPRYAVVSKSFVLRVGCVYFFNCTASGKKKEHFKKPKRKKIKFSPDYTHTRSSCPSYF